MFNPKYRVLITVESFPRDKFICLGSQLISIVEFIKGFLPDHLWYKADVDAIGKHAKRHQNNNFKLVFVGNDLKLNEYCSGIEQFIWGVFLCIDKNALSENSENIELETEDKPFRPIDCDGVLMELRTFDTSYFEIYSEDLEIIKTLSQKYSVDIEYRYKDSLGKAGA